MAYKLSTMDSNSATIFAYRFRLQDQIYLRENAHNVTLFAYVDSHDHYMVHIALSVLNYP